jgi:hypothetical protein
VVTIMSTGHSYIIVVTLMLSNRIVFIHCSTRVFHRPSTAVAPLSVNA